jgi:hypothetical protein
MRGSQTVRREAQWTPIFRLEFAWGLGLRGIVVGPNWMALSDRRVTHQSVSPGDRWGAVHGRSVEPVPLPDRIPMIDQAPLVPR